MKKVVNLFVAAAMGLPLVFSSCAKEDPAKPLEVNWNRTAVLKGTLLINADITKDRADQKLSAPSITRDAFFVSIPYSSLNSEAEGDYILPKDKIEYKTNGEFTITAPVGVSATKVTVRVSDFSGTLKKTISGTDKTIDVIWKPSKIVGVDGSSLSLSPGGTAYFPNWILDAFISEDYYTEVKSDGSPIE